MKKSGKTLLIMLAVLAVLGGAAAALLLFPAGTEEEGDVSSAASQEEREMLLELAEEDITAVRVENSLGSFTILPTEAPPQETEASGEESGTEPGIAYTLEGLEAYDLDANKLKSAVETLLSIQVNRGLGRQDGLEKYGLAGQRAGKVTIERKSGGAVELTLGDTSSSGTAGQYVLKDKEVYIVGALSSLFQGSQLDCVSTEVYSVPAWTVASVDEEGSATEEALEDTMLSCTISGTAFPQPVEMQYVEQSRYHGYMIQAPIVAQSDSTKMDDMVAALKSLTASSVAAVNVEESGLEEYGLAEPAACVTFTMNQADPITLRASAKDADNNRYLLLEGRDVVYKVRSVLVSAWAEADLMALRLPTVCPANIADVEHLVWANDGLAFDFAVDLGESTVQIGGYEVAYEDYQSFFQQMTGLSVFSMEEAPYEDVGSFRVEYQYKNGTSDVLAFFPVEGFSPEEGPARYAVTLNGEFNGLVRSSDINALRDQRDALCGFMIVD